MRIEENWPISENELVASNDKATSPPINKNRPTMFEVRKPRATGMPLSVENQNAWHYNAALHCTYKLNGFEHAPHSVDGLAASSHNNNSVITIAG